MTRGDSGTLNLVYRQGASQRVIVTPAQALAQSTPPVVHWLTPDAGSSWFIADLELSGPTLLEFSAYGPMGGLQSAHR